MSPLEEALGAITLRGGDELPEAYGVGYVRLESLEIVAYRIPLHWVARCGRWLYRWVRFGGFPPEEAKVVWARQQEAFDRGFQLGWREAHRESRRLAGIRP